VLNVTLSQLQADVQLRADVQNSTAAFPLTELADYINRGIARVHGLLAISGEPYYRSQATFSASQGQQQYYTTAASGVPAGTAVLPTDIFRVEALDAQVQNATWANCYRFNWERRNDYQSTSLFFPVQATPLFDFMGSGANASLYLQPPPSGATPFRLWYYPVPTVLASGSDTWDSANRWDEYVVAFAAKLVAERDQNYELVDRLAQMVMGMEATIKAEAESRISGQAPKVRRSRYRRNIGWPWGTGGLP